REGRAGSVAKWSLAKHCGARPRSSGSEPKGDRRPRTGAGASVSLAAGSPVAHRGSRFFVDLFDDLKRRTTFQGPGRRMKLRDAFNGDDQRTADVFVRSDDVPHA